MRIFLIFIYLLICPLLVFASTNQITYIKLPDGTIEKNTTEVFLSTELNNTILDLSNRRDNVVRERDNLNNIIRNLDDQISEQQNALNKPATVNP